MADVNDGDSMVTSAGGPIISPLSQVHARSAWELEMGDLATVPTKYERASALLLGWEPDSCDTGVAGELEKLGEVLQILYHFDVQTGLMNTTIRPQQQAFKHLANFVAAHDKPRTLLIVYYAGHGYSSANGMGSIALSGKPIYDESEKLAGSIEWHEVERTLIATSSDVLMIFDCCHAGLLCRSAQEGFLNRKRIFQYLGACESGQVTSRAGKRSFTSALIWALKELATETAFPVTQLVKKLMSHEHFPKDQQPVLFGGRFDPVSEHICLAPMRARAIDSGSESSSSSNNKITTRGFVELKFHFPGDVTETDMIQTARVLKACMHGEKLRCEKISFIDKYSLDTADVVKRWKNLVQSTRQRSVKLVEEPGDVHDAETRFSRRIRLLVGKVVADSSLILRPEERSGAHRQSPLIRCATVRNIMSTLLLEVIRSCIGPAVFFFIVWLYFGV